MEWRAATSQDNHDVAARLFVEIVELCGLTPTPRIDDLLTAVALIQYELFSYNELYPPIVTNNPPVQDKKQHQKEPYEYKHRGLYSIVHAIAKNYGWSRREILDLHMVEAIRYLQEIELETFSEREWEAKLSELFYDKQGKYRPIRKPVWMTRKVIKKDDPRMKVRIPTYLMAVGNVIDLTGYNDATIKTPTD